MAARVADLFLTGDDEAVDIPPALFAPFEPKKKPPRRVKLAFDPFTGKNASRSVVDAVAAALALEHPILHGRLKGRVVSFA